MPFNTFNSFYLSRVNFHIEEQNSCSVFVSFDFQYHGARFAEQLQVIMLDMLDMDMDMLDTKSYFKHYLSRVNSNEEKQKNCTM